MGPGRKEDMLSFRVSFVFCEKCPWATSIGLLAGFERTSVETSFEIRSDELITQLSSISVCRETKTKFCHWRSKDN